MQLDTYLRVSQALLALSHRLERAVFDLKCLIPQAFEPDNQRMIELSVTHALEKLAHDSEERQQLFATLLALLTQGHSELPPALAQMLIEQIQNWHDQHQSYLDQLLSLRQRLKRQPQQADPLKALNNACSEIAGEDSEGLKKIALLLGGSLLQQYPSYFTKQATIYQGNALIHNRQFLFSLMSYQAGDNHELPSEAIYRFLAWVYGGVLPRKVQIKSARDVMPNAAATGLSADAITLTFRKTTEVFFLLKGTEFHQDDSVKSRNPLDGLQKGMIEAYRDWRYNVQAILLGQDTEFSQIAVAKAFIETVQKSCPADAHFFGVGHSLGGHLVQALQLVYHLFEAGYTLNAAPVQLRQIQKLAPDLFSEETWRALKSATVNGSISPSNPTLIKKILGYDHYPIQNEGFDQDIIQIFYNMPYNIYVGQFHFVRKPRLRYPFLTEIYKYWTSDETAFVVFIMQQFFTKTQENTADQSLRNQIIRFILTWHKEDYLTQAQIQKYSRDYNQYFLKCRLLKPNLPNDANRRLPWVPKVLSKRFSSNKIALIRRLQPDMCELLLYFHMVSGARYFFD